MNSSLLSFLVIFVALFSATAVDNCAITPAELLASGNTCIDLKLCPVIGGDAPICPFVYFPVCGCDGVTYSNACYAQSSGVSKHTIGKCGGATSLRA